MRQNLVKTALLINGAVLQMYLKSFLPSALPLQEWGWRGERFAESLATEY